MKKKNLPTIFREGMTGISEVVSGLEMDEGRVVGARSFLLTWLLQNQYTQQAEVRS